jgi:hypothetical protein
MKGKDKSLAEKRDFFMDNSAAYDRETGNWQKGGIFPGSPVFTGEPGPQLRHYKWNGR